VARVLIVEDEQTDRVILAGIVEGMGHEVYYASDGGQAFKTYIRMNIDIVVTDISLPNVDGPEFILSLKTLFPEAPIIAVSGKGPELLAYAQDNGAYAVLSKPIDHDELVAAIASAAPDNHTPLPPRSNLAARRTHRSLDTV